MALNISRPTSFGVDATYWRIISAQIDFGKNRMAIFMAGYTSEEARDAGAAPLVQEQVDFIAESFIPDATRSVVYDALKTLPDWKEAEDV